MNEERKVWYYLSAGLSVEDDTPRWISLFPLGWRLMHTRFNGTKFELVSDCSRDQLLIQSHREGAD